MKLPRIKAELRQTHRIFEKIDNEVKLFNSMCIVMPCRKRVPLLYINYLSNLVTEPRCIQRGSDGYAKLMYLCACANLFALTCNKLIRKQLLKNCLYVFGRTVIKQKSRFVLINKCFTAFKLKRFKLLGSKFVDKPDFEVIGEDLKRRDSGSYITYYNKNLSLKRYAHKRLPVECFEVTSLQKRTFSLKVAADKMRYSLSHTADTFFCIGDGRAVGVYVAAKAEFGSSICEKGEELKVYAALENENKIFIIKSISKAEIVRVVQEIKRLGNKLDYLCDKREAVVVRETEALMERAYLSRFTEGDELKEKFTAATKYVPTLFLPTLVYEITEQTDFFNVVDAFWLFKRIAAAGQNLNIVFLYSGLNDTVREIINAFADKGEARELIKTGVFLFFINRVTANSKAVNYLSLIVQAQSQHLLYNPQITNNKNIEVNRHISASFPVTHSVFVRNTTGKSQNARVSILIEIGGEYPACVAKKGTGICITGLKPGSRSNSLKLPLGARVRSDTGKVIVNSEVACNKVFIECDVKLLANEEKVLKIIKNDGGLGRRERKDAFIGSLDDFVVKAEDIRLGQLFKIEIVDDKNEKLLTAVKAAVRSFDKEMFFGLFGKRAQMPVEIWTLLMEKVIGLRLLKGKFQLMPCVQITGDFELSFSYSGTPYNFTVKQKSGGFSVKYGENEYRNFLQVAVK